MPAIITGYHDIYGPEGLVSSTPIYSELIHAQQAQIQLIYDTVTSFCEWHLPTIEQTQLLAMAARIQLDHGQTITPARQEVIDYVSAWMTFTEDLTVYAHTLGFQVMQAQTYAEVLALAPNVNTFVVPPKLPVSVLILKWRGLL